MVNYAGVDSSVNQCKYCGQGFRSPGLLALIAILEHLAQHSVY